MKVAINEVGVSPDKWFSMYDYKYVADGVGALRKDVHFVSLAILMLRCYMILG